MPFSCLSLSSVLCYYTYCPSSVRLSSLRIPSLWYLYPLYSASSAIKTPSDISGLWQIYASLSLAPRKRRMLDLTINSDIRAITKPHIYEYSCFSLLLSSEARHCCATMVFVMGIPSVEYTIGVKERLLSRKGWS